MAQTNDEIPRRKDGRRNWLLTPEGREWNKKMLAKKWKEPEYRKRMIDANTGLPSPQKGIKLKEEHRRIAIKTLLKGGWNKGKKMSEAFRQKSRDKWANEEWARKQFERMKFKPTEPERYLDALFQLTFPNEWKYVGDGEVWIARKNPDFINCNGKKLIIEFNGFYTHTKEHNEERAKLFSNYGFRTLNLYYPDLSDEVMLIEKIRGFTHEQK